MIKCLIKILLQALLLRTLPSLLLPAIQMSLLLLDASSKLFYHTILGNFNIQYHYIINLNGFINYKQFLRAALLKIPVT